jgi:hypothetical protein
MLIRFRTKVDIEKTALPAVCRSGDIVLFLPDRDRAQAVRAR